MRLYIDKTTVSARETLKGEYEKARPHTYGSEEVIELDVGDPIIPRRCHEIAFELYSIRVARPIARRFRTLEETLLHFGLSRPGLKLLHRASDRR